VAQPTARLAQGQDEAARRGTPSAGDDDDLTRADIDRVARHHTERNELAPADDAIAEIVELARAFLVRPTQDVGAVAHHETHPFGPGHPIAPAPRPEALIPQAI
jgi:histone H3/H4